MITEHRRKMLALYSRLWRKRHPEKRKEVIRSFYKRHRSKILDDCRKKYVMNKKKIDSRIKRYQKSEAYKFSRRLWLKKNRLRLNAYQAVRRAINSGKLIRKPCEECGLEKTEAHHQDYTKRLKVNWLCKFHHKIKHGWSPTP